MNVLKASTQCTLWYEQLTVYCISQQIFSQQFSITLEIQW